MITKEQQEINNLEAELPAQYVRFAHEYVKDLHKGKSAVRAGYSPNGAHVQAGRMLQNARVSRLVQLLNAKTLRRIDISAEAVLMELAKIAFSDPRDVVEWDGRNVRVKTFDEMNYPEVIKELEVESLKDRDGFEYGTVRKVKMYGKLEALKMLAQYNALFTTNVNITGIESSQPSGGAPVRVIINQRKPGDALEGSNVVVLSGQGTTTTALPVGTEDAEIIEDEDDLI